MKKCKKKSCNIIWEKWEDPFDVAKSNETDFLDNLESDNYDDLIGDLEEIDHDHTESQKAKSFKLIITPFGPMSPDISSLSNSFKFWVGHADFDLTNDILSIIENTVGVEILTVFTRYRFRIGVGKAFTDRQVMVDIQKNISLYYQKE